MSRTGQCFIIKWKFSCLTLQLIFLFLGSIDSNLNFHILKIPFPFSVLSIFSNRVFKRNVIVYDLNFDKRCMYADYARIKRNKSDIFTQPFITNLKLLLCLNKGQLLYYPVLNNNWSENCWIVGLKCH